jgi:hypothetical protein
LGSFLSPLAAQLKHPDKQKHKDVLTNNSNTLRNFIIKYLSFYVIRKFQEVSAGFI